MSGKKHFVEKLFVYWVLARAEKDAARRAAWVEKFRAAWAPANDAAFHEIDESDVELLRQEAMPYLSAAHLAASLGVASEATLAAVARRAPAIERDLPNRPIHWQMGLSYLLEKLGRKPPVTRDELMGKGLLAARRGTDSLSVEDVYALVHEVFYLSDQGDRDMKWPSADARLWAQAALPFLVRRAIRDDDADLLAELLVATRFAGFSSNEAFADGVRHLLTRQNENGSFGRYERRRAELARAGSRFDVDVGGYLHTTEVAIWALVQAREARLSTSAGAAPTRR
jgi:hypothetical protein